MPKRDLSAIPASTFATFAAISGVVALSRRPVRRPRSRPPPSRASATSSATKAHHVSASCKKRRAPDAETTADGRPTRPRSRSRREDRSQGSGLRRRLAVRPARHRLRQHRPHRALARVDGSGWSPHADGRVQRHRQGALAPLEHLLRRADAVDAAHHLVGRRHARRRRSRLSGLARLHPPSGSASRRSSTA